MMLGLPKATTALLEVIEALLEERPGEWCNDHYNLEHRQAKISIWIANAAYGLHIEVSGARIGLNWRWRRRMRWAVDKHLALKAVANLKQAVGLIRAA